MKKSTILSFATAGAIIATSVGTFAAWDTTEATSTGTMSVASPVSITSSNVTYTQNARALGDVPSYSADVSFNVVKADQTISKLTVQEVKVYADDDVDKATDLSTNFDIKIEGASGNSDVTGGSTAVDTSVETTNAYKVTLTPKEASKDVVAGNTFTVDVKAKIE